MGRFAGLFVKAKAAAAHYARHLPAEEFMYVETRKSKKGWRWVIVAGNGAVIVESRRYYTRERDAERAYDRYMAIAPRAFGEASRPQ